MLRSHGDYNADLNPGSRPAYEVVLNRHSPVNLEFLVCGHVVRTYVCIGLRCLHSHSDLCTYECSVDLQCSNAHKHNVHTHIRMHTNDVHTYIRIAIYLYGKKVLASCIHTFGTVHVIRNYRKSDKSCTFCADSVKLPCCEL